MLSLLPHEIGPPKSVVYSQFFWFLQALSLTFSRSTKMTLVSPFKLSVMSCISKGRPFTNTFCRYRSISTGFLSIPCDCKYSTADLTIPSICVSFLNAGGKSSFDVPVLDAGEPGTVKGVLWLGTVVEELCVNAGIVTVALLVQTRSQKGGRGKNPVGYKFCSLPSMVSERQFSIMFFQKNSNQSVRVVLRRACVNLSLLINSNTARLNVCDTTFNNTRQLLPL